MTDDSDDDLDIGDSYFIDIGISVEIVLRFALTLIAIIVVAKYWMG